jgi:glycosyltransferase involved in cell wall biosynthesis
LAAAQASLGCAAAIVSYRFPKAQERIDAALGAIPHMPQVRLEYLPPLTKPERFLARGARRRLLPIVDEFDWVHLHGVWDPLIYAAAAAAAERGKPYALTVHGMLHPWALRQKSWKKRAALALGYRRMLNAARFLHLGNDAERELIAPLELTPPTRIVPNGVFLEQFDPLPPRGAFRQAHPELAGAKIVLFLGRLHYMKGLDFLAEAMAIVVAKFPDAHLAVVGPDAGAKTAFQSQVARLGITDRVHLLGPLYAGQKIAALHDCDCFCLPSRREGFSMAVIEALACQAPAVLSTECFFPEVAGASAGIVVELSAPAVAAGIETVLQDPAAAATMGLAARNLVASRFTWPKVAQQMIEGYHAMAQ